MDLQRILLSAALLFFTSSAIIAQTNNTQPARRTPTMNRGERATTEQEKNTNNLTVRAKEFNDRVSQEIDDATWVRVIYRQLDLQKEENAPLYYPTQPVNGQQNLFSLIFRLMNEGQIEAYEYLDGYESFEAEHKINFKEMLDRFYIYYDQVATGRGNRDTTIVINDSDIPSAQVLSYYVKEAWYFDQMTSDYDTKTIAICPILHSDGDMGATTMPMFWLPYENIRPYIHTEPIMVSNVNNAMTYTVDDYFRQRMFKGDIIKTQNMLNRPLAAYCPTPDSLKREQERIEKQLTQFEDNLWMEPDTAMINAVEREMDAKDEKKKQPEKKEEEKKEKVSKPKATKQQSSAPVRSIRRR